MWGWFLMVLDEELEHRRKKEKFKDLKRQRKKAGRKRT